MAIIALPSRPSLPLFETIKMPSNTTYKIVDTDGRLAICKCWAAGSNYALNELVWVIDPELGIDAIYECIQATTGDASWTQAQSKFRLVTLSQVYGEILEKLTGGIHYIGKTTSDLYEGATTNPITVNGATKQAVAGDLVILDPADYTTGVAYSANHFIEVTSGDNQGIYIVTSDISAAENTSFANIISKVQLEISSPEFIWDGSSWNLMGTFNAKALGKLAYKDNASGTVSVPTAATVTVYQPTKTYSRLVQTVITPVSGTTSVTKMTAGTAKAVASTGTAVVYGTANVGSEVSCGNADVGTATTVVASITSLGVNVVTDVTAVDTTVDGTTLNISTAVQSKQTGFLPTGANSTSITPAKAATTKITPAVAAPNTQTIIPAVDNGTITPYTSANVTVAVASTDTMYVATGSISSTGTGETVVVAVDSTSTTATVNLSNQTKTVTVS